MIKPKHGLWPWVSVLVPVMGSPTLKTIESVKSPVAGVYDPDALEKQIGVTIAQDLEESGSFKKTPLP